MYVLSIPKNSGPLAPKQIGLLVADGLTSALPGEWTVTADGVRSINERQSTDLVLQRASGSRAAHGVWFYPRLVVRDAGLKDWALLNADLFDSASEGRLFNSLLVNFTPINTVFVSQSHTDPKSATYHEFLSVLVDSVLPSRELMHAPETLLDLPDRWLWDVEGMLLWSVSRDRADLCWQLIDRNLGTGAARRGAFARGLRHQKGGEPYDRFNNLESLGYLVGRLSERFEFGAAPRWLDV